MSNAISVERGCGERVAGGCYAELGLGAGGSPLEDFMVDPPLVVDLNALGVTPIGVKLFERDGVWHVIDWIGSQHYPNVADFLEEVRRFGLSRRLPQTLDFSKLTPKSRILLVHARAWVQNFDDYAAQWVTGLKPGSLADYYDPCPKSKADHAFDHHPSMCAGVWWQDIEGDELVLSNRLVDRRMPSFTFTAVARPDDVTPVYCPAIFARFPISRLVVIDDPAGKKHEQATAAARKSSLPVDVEPR
jgi:hypothetical protein